MYRETLHTHFDWIGTDTGRGPQVLTPELTPGPVIAQEALPPSIWARIRPCTKPQINTLGYLKIRHEFYINYF